VDRGRPRPHQRSELQDLRAAAGQKDRWTAGVLARTRSQRSEVKSQNVWCHGQRCSNANSSQLLNALPVISRSNHTDSASRPRVLKTPRTPLSVPPVSSMHSPEGHQARFENENEEYSHTRTTKTLNVQPVFAIEPLRRGRLLNSQCSSSKIGSRLKQAYHPFRMVYILTFIRAHQQSQPVPNMSVFDLRFAIERPTASSR